MRYPQQTFCSLRQVYHHTFAEVGLPLALTLVTAPGTSISLRTAAIIYDLEICSLGLVYRNKNKRNSFLSCSRILWLFDPKERWIFYRQRGGRVHREESPVPGQWPCLFCVSLTFMLNLINFSNFFMVTYNCLWLSWWGKSEWGELRGEWGGCQASAGEMCTIFQVNSY